MEGRSLSANSHFETFGFTAADHSRKQAEKEHHERSMCTYREKGHFIPVPFPKCEFIPVQVCSANSYLYSIKIEISYLYLQNRAKFGVNVNGSKSTVTVADSASGKRVISYPYIF